MALIDVKDYYFKMLQQYLEMKKDMADFDSACKDGYITEEQLEIAKDDFNKVEQNYNRLSFIMYLFTIPRSKKNRKLYKNSQLHSDMLKLFQNLKSDANTVIDENTNLIAHFRKELSELKKSTKR